MATVKVIASGRAAHAGNHHADGKNAIWALARFIMKARAKSDRIRFEAIEGGQSRNTVPEHASVRITCPEELLSELDLESDVEGTLLTIER
jgi:glutamate carboxypeptidase